MQNDEYRDERSTAGRSLPRPFRWLAVACVLALTTVATALAGSAGCPSAETMRAQLARLDLERGARTKKFERPVPTQLYEKACKQVGKPFTKRDGDRGEGVIVAEVPVAALWKALNDENRHGEEGSPIPVQHSEVIDGTPRGESRVIFQWAKKFGFGRWWVSRVWMNGDLFRESEGALWELRWESQAADPERPPMNSISSDLSPIEHSEGAWLLVPLGESCTLIEYFNWSDPGGGMVGFTQPMVFSKGLRQTVAGVVAMAEEYRVNATAKPEFLLPDGTPFD